VSEIAALQGAANATEPASNKSAPRARAVDRTHLLFLKQVFSALFTSKCTLGDDVISREQFAAVTLKTIIWTRTAKTLCRFAKRAAGCSRVDLAAADTAPAPPARWLGPWVGWDERGAGSARAVAAQRRCETSGRSGLNDLNDLNELNDL
jgi:hypothetical protein